MIVSRIGSLAELVDDGRTGLLFEPGDSADLAVKVRWMLQHPDRCRQMGLAARREYERRYTPERNYPKLMGIYELARHNFERRQSKRKAS